MAEESKQVMEQVKAQEDDEEIKEEQSEDPKSTVVEENQYLNLNGMSPIMNLKRFSYLGSFEPVYIFSNQYIDVPKFWPIVSALVKEIESNDFVTFMREILNDVTLIRRDEPLFIYAAYLASSVDIKHKTEVRIVFPILIQTDDDLFLFCKYANLIGKEKNQKCFSRTVQKAIKAWYESKSSSDFLSMWKSHRGLHGMSHRVLIKLFHISDKSINSDEFPSPFFKTCTEIMKEKGVETVTPALNGSDTKPFSHSSKGSSAPSNELAAISQLRTTKKKHDAIKVIRKHHITYKHMPSHLLRHPVIMGAMVPTMPYLQILKHWRKMIRFNHFANDSVFKSCKTKLEDLELAKQNRIYPVHLLMGMNDIKKEKEVPEKKAHPTKINYLDQLYKESFTWPAESRNLRMCITVNLQQGYLKKLLKNHKKLSYYEACLALCLGYCKREAHVDVFHWTEDKKTLKRIPFTKSNTTELDFAEFGKIEVKKNPQTLVTPLQVALNSEQIYDVFLCIVPKAGRGNPKQNSNYLVSHLDQYRAEKNPNARFIILNLLKFKRRSMRFSDTRLENIMEICGLDDHTTDLINNFATNRFD